MGDKSELERKILLEWYHNPGKTNEEIGDSVGCSASYVSQVKNEYDDYDALEADIDASVDVIESDLEATEELFEEDGLL